MSRAPLFISANELAVHAAEETREHSALLNFNTGGGDANLLGTVGNMLLNNSSYQVLGGWEGGQFGK